MLELGILADDLTGGMMVASLLEAEGIRCPLVSSVEALAAIDPVSAEAVVVARKIRLIDPHLAVTEAQAVVAAMKKLGIERFYYKYCATFDCTDRGNIGPVALAMLEARAVPRQYFARLFRGIRLLCFRAGCLLVRRRWRIRLKSMTRLHPC